MKIVVGSRGSNLAVTQTKMVMDMIKMENPGIELELKTIKTKGDIFLDTPIDKLGGKEIFIKEIEKELLESTIDMAVHSMKDMPGDLPKGLKLSSSPEREDHRDVLVLKEGLKSIDDIPRNGKIGTGSKRRKYQMLEYRPDLDIVGIRGNIETRINKIETENLYGVILAAAGIHRLGLELGQRAVYLDNSIMLSSPTQGILAIEVRENDEKMDKILKTIAHEKTEIQAIIERAFLKEVGGSCTIPVGAYCEVEDDKIYLDGLLGSDDGQVLIRKSIVGNLDSLHTLGQTLARDIIKEMN